MFGNNKQETINRINEITNEAEKLQRRIFKLRTFIESKLRLPNLTHSEDDYVRACQVQMSYMKSYYETLQERAIKLQASLEK